MTDTRSELETRRALQQAIQAGDQRSELATRRALAAAPASPPDSTVVGAAARGAGEKILGNIAALPDVAARGFQGVRQLLAGQPGQALEAVRTEQIPTPSGREVNAFLAGVESLPRGLVSGQPIAAFREAQQEVLGESEQMARERPIATGAGEVAGDALTMLALRAPGVSARAALPAAAAPTAGGTVTLPRLAQQVLRSGPVAKLARGLGRTGEAGAEGAVIAALNDNDPLFTSGAAAGAQVAGSLTTAALRNPGKTFVGLAALILATREAIPTFDPSVFEAVDVAANKVGLGIVTGLVTALPAARLAGRNQSAAASALLDAVSALPRGSMQSVLDSVIASGQRGTDSAAQVAQRVLNDAESLTEDQIRRFERAVRNSDAEEFDELLGELDGKDPRGNGR